MPRHPRLFIPGATYHVYCRVARGGFIFDDDSEAIEFIGVVARNETLMVGRFSPGVSWATMIT